MASASGSCLEVPALFKFLLGLDSAMEYDREVGAEVSPFIPKVLSVTVFYHSKRNPD